MAPILVIIHYKGEQFKKYFNLDDVECKHFEKIYILLTDKYKNNNNYHFICVMNKNNNCLNNSLVIIPSTSIVPKESAYINITFKDESCEVFNFNIPIHTIYNLGIGVSSKLKLDIII